MEKENTDMYGETPKTRFKRKRAARTEGGKPYNSRRPDIKAIAAFLSGFCMFIAVCLPDLINCGGVLVFNGDYASQSIPFTYHIYDMLHGFNTGWDTSSGLGSDFLTSYAYYGAFSPFTLLYLILPRGALIYAMPCVTAVKYGTGALFAYFWIKRFVKDPNYAVIGGMVYMFSSFSAYNEVFHFTDIIALFPLFMLALDELCINDRRGVFALSAALMALTNYYFFFGQVVFAVIYFLCRYTGRDLRGFLHRLALTALEGAIGVMMSCAVLLPVAHALANSPKATGLMQGSDMLLFDSVYKYLHILQSVFSVPDGFALTTVFPETDLTYPFGMLGASVAAYIPFFSAAGVISFLFLRNGVTWEKRLVAVCAVFALVPVLNQSFSAFNSAYYARWYYMPMLVCVMISVRALEDGISFRPGIITCGTVLAGLAAYRFIFSDDALRRLSTPRAVFNSALGIIDIAIAALSLVVLIVAVRSKRDREFLPKQYIFSYLCIYMCYGIMTFYNLTGFDFEDKNDMVALYRFGEELPDTVQPSDRSVMPAMTANFNMVWGTCGTAYFNSLYDPGFGEFLSRSGLMYDNGLYADISVKYKELASLVSVKYYFAPENARGNYDGMTKAGRFGSYDIYENPDYIPMGFTYDEMISGQLFDSISSDEEKHRAYMRYLVTDEPELLADMLELRDGTYSPVTEEEYRECVRLRRSGSAAKTEISSGTVVSDITLERENIVFYPISFNEGWSAYSDGEMTGIYKVNNGLIGVRVPAGEHRVELRYRTPLSGEGLAATVGGLAAYAAYIAVSRLRRKRKG